MKGDIPTFEHLSNLEVIDLSSNHDLTGMIPDFSHLLELKELYIYQNNLEACFPSFVCDLDVFRAEKNNKLPWNGDHTNFCLGMSQSDVPCNTDDSMPLEGIIDSSCYCMPLIADYDNDGYSSPEDCDDSNADINPGLVEIPYNYLDDDCNPSTLDDDLDGDGYFFGTHDCDDSDPNINAYLVEIPYNSKDDDCDPNTLDDDLDQDGFLLANDCDDNNAAINPDAEEIPNNGVDEDCDGMDLTSSLYGIAPATINIYPNPATDIINIDIKGHHKYDANVYDLEGHLIISTSNQSTINIETLANGIYLIEIKDLDSGQKVIERIMIGR